MLEDEVDEFSLIKHMEDVVMKGKDELKKSKKVYTLL